MKMLNVYIVVGAGLFAPIHAAVLVVDFGSTNSGYSGYNEVETLVPLLSSSLALVNTDGSNSGFSLSYAGSTTPTSSSAAGIGAAMTRSPEAAAAWSSMTGGEDISKVSSQGLGFATSSSQVGVFTLDGLVIGERYSLMLLSGAGSTGGNSYLSFVGLESDYSFAGYDSASGKTAAYTVATDTLLFSNYAGSGTIQSLSLDFTASSDNLEIRIGGAPFQQAVQALAFVPEPTVPLFSLVGVAGCLFLRRKR